jgi:hypothetical protein
MGINRKTFLLYLLQIPFLIPLMRGFLKRTNSKKFLLYKFSVAGSQFYDGDSVINDLKVGGLLKLVNEPNNPFDKFAVKIKYQDKQIGYIPRSDNRYLSRMLEQGIELDCEVLSLQPDVDPGQKIQVAVYLIKIPIDFGKA